MLNANNLRTVRQFLDLYQSQLADMIGVDRSYIAHIEGGYKPFTASLQARTMHALKLTHDKVTAIVAAQQAYEDARQALVN